MSLGNDDIRLIAWRVLRGILHLNHDLFVKKSVGFYSQRPLYRISYHPHPMLLCNAEYSLRFGANASLRTIE